MKSTTCDIFKPIERSLEEAIDNNRDMYDAVNSLPLKKATREYIFHIIVSQPILTGNRTSILSDSQARGHRNALAMVIYEFILRGYSNGEIFSIFWEALYEEEYWDELSNRIDLLDIIIGLVDEIAHRDNHIADLELEDQ